MAETFLPALGIAYNYDLGGNGWKNGVDRNFVIADSLIESYCVSSIVTAEPGSPSVGDTYILAATQTGTNWGADAGAVEHAVAIYTNVAGQAGGSPWLYITPKEGWIFWDRANDYRLIFTGSVWQTIGAPAPPPIVTAASTHTPTIKSAWATTYIDNTAHTLTIPTNASVPYMLGTESEFINEHANAITVSSSGITWRAGGQALNSAGIAGNSRCVIHKTATDTWFVKHNAAHPT